MRKPLFAAALAALFLASSTASAQYTNDGRNRWVRINNIGLGVVITVYAVPSHWNMRPPITSKDWIPNVTIGSRQSYSVNFDDGSGTCVYDLRATSDRQGWDWVEFNFDVCARSNWDLGN